MKKVFISLGVILFVAACSKPPEKVGEPQIGDLFPGFEPCALGADGKLPICETFRDKFQTKSITMFIESTVPNNTRCCTTEFLIVDGVMTPVGEKCKRFEGACPPGWWRP